MMILRRHRARSFAAMAAVGLVLTALGAAPAAQAAGPGHAKRVIASNFADPGFAHFGSYYYLYSTGAGFPVRRATSPSGPYRKVTTSGLSMPHLPSWVGKGADGGRHLWAPHVFAVNDSKGRPLYVMYFVGYKKSWGANCVGVATSRSPYSGFAATGMTICAVHSDHEAIDPSAYRAANGKRYIIFKTNVGNVRDFRIQSVQMGTQLGVTPVRGTRRTLVSSPSAKMEAPSVIRHGGKVWLFLARGDYANCTYSTDAWSAATFTSTYHRVRTIMSSSSTGLCGPGGATVLPDGKATRIAFHSWKNGTAASKVRVAWVGVLKWTSSGSPYLY
jgi:glycosyl hydrolase family 43